MPTKRCSICQHPRRSLIDLALITRTPATAIAARFGVTSSALYWHRKHHLSPTQAAALLTALKPSEIDLEALERSESQGLLGELVEQRAKLRQFSEMAAELGNINAAVSAEKGITAALELTSKLLGMLVTRHELRSTSLLISADYIEMRSAILAALRPFPEASRAVAAALAKIEVRAADEITKAGKPLLLEAQP